MIVVSISAQNQVKDIISQFCNYKTPQEYGRSAFWIWIDKIHNEVNSISIKQAKKIDGTQYMYCMQYWGKIFFTARRIRVRGKFAGSVLTVTEFKFDEDNFYKWLQHEAPIEHKEPLPNIPNKRCKPQDIKLGFTKINGKSGLWAIADSNGDLISNDWFNDVSYMWKTPKGEIATIVNKNGWAYAYYPNREDSRRLITMNKLYSNVIGESVFRRVLREQFQKLHHRYILNEKFYNPSEEPIVDGKIGEYDVLDGAEWEQIICDLPQKGWVEDIRMYSAMGHGGKTYCLYRRMDNGKYFFAEVFDDKKDKKYLHAKALSKKNVPTIIWRDAVSLIRCS